VWKPQNDFVVDTLDNVIKANPKIASLYLHNDFAPGVPPAVLVCKKPVALSGSSEQCLKALKAVAGCDHLEALWQIVVEGGRIQPKRVAVVVKKQIIVPAQGRWKKP
jgi:hypothetical protein